MKAFQPANKYQIITENPIRPNEIIPRVKETDSALGALKLMSRSVSPDVRYNVIRSIQRENSPIKNAPGFALNIAENNYYQADFVDESG